MSDAARSTDPWAQLKRLPIDAGSVGRVRRAVGINQSAMARVLGVDRVTVARWEAARMTPSPDHVAMLLELTASELSLRMGSGAASAGGAGRARSTARARGELFAAVLMFGARVRLPRERWVELLQVDAHILAQVPATTGSSGVAFCSGHGIGLALESALTGERGTDDADRASRADRRLINEVLFQAQLLRRAAP
jgi:transcriptional regulator with XRE-family HTH domain